MILFGPWDLQERVFSWSLSPTELQLMVLRERAYFVVALCPWNSLAREACDSLFNLLVETGKDEIVKVNFNLVGWFRFSSLSVSTWESGTKDGEAKMLSEWIGKPANFFAAFLICSEGGNIPLSYGTTARWLAWLSAKLHCRQVLKQLHFVYFFFLLSLCLMRCKASWVL